jgi:hypothetical protein
LLTSKMAAFSATRDATIPDALIAAWDLAVASWDVPARHDEVLRLVAQHDAYAWAAARYRTRAGDPVGDRELERVRKAAEVALLATQTKRPARTGRVIAVVLLVVTVAVLGGLLYFTVIARGQGSINDGEAPTHLRLKPLGSQPLPPGK